MKTGTHPALQPVARSPHYGMLGGREAVMRLVDAFYRQMDAHAEARVIRAMHDADLGPTKAVLVMYLSQWLGGPADYSAARGEPRLRSRHAAYTIGLAERDAWLACMRAALDETCADAALNDTLMLSFSKVADAIRNTGNSQPAHHGPAHGLSRAAVPIRLSNFTTTKESS